MKKCLGCGKTLAEDELFCPECGTKAPEEVPKIKKAQFCANCGQRLEEDMLFCPNCGFKTAEDNVKLCEESQNGKSNNLENVHKIGSTIASKFVGAGKKKFAAGTGIVVFAAIVILLTQTVFASPANKFVKYQKEFFLDVVMGEVGEMCKTYNELTELSTDITITAESDNSYYDDIFEDSSIVLRTELKKREALINAEVNIMGNDLVKGTVSYDEGTLGLYLPEMKDKYYIVNLNENKTLVDDFGLPEGIESLEIPNIDSKQIKQLVGKYLEVLLQTVNEENTTVEKNTTIKLIGIDENVKGDLYIFKPTVEDLKSTISTFTETLDNDEEIYEFVKTTIGTNEDFLNSIGMNFEDDLDFVIKYACDNLDSYNSYIAEMLADSGFRWEIGVSHGKICYNALVVKEDGEMFAYDSYKGNVAAYYAYDEEFRYGALLSYKKDGKTYSGSLKTAKNDNTLFELKFSNIKMNKKSSLHIRHGKYEFIFKGGSEIVMNVHKGETGGTDHILQIGQMVFNINTTDKKSTVSKPKADIKDLTDYNEEAFEQFVEDLEDYYFELRSSLYELI